LKALSFTAVILFFLVSCSGNDKAGPAKEVTSDSSRRQAKNFLSDCNKLYAEARKMDSILLTQYEVDVDASQKAIQAFTDFAYYCHKDSLGPIYLIKTAQVARAINNIPQAKLVLEKCIDDYPTFSNRPAALFLLAQLYDEVTYLNNEEEARRLYTKIIEEYPKSDWAPSARGALQLIGKSDEEIMQELKRKNKNKK
jgi:outer membrane protein assembly factor BamD (BamD/ComL family)